MARLTFTIEGPPGTVTLRAMLSAFQSQLTILSELDAALADRGRPSLEWYVSGLRGAGPLEPR